MNDQRIAQLIEEKARLEAEKAHLETEKARKEEKRDGLATERDNTKPSKQRSQDIRSDIAHLDQEIHDLNDHIKNLDAQILATISSSKQFEAFEKRLLEMSEQVSEQFKKMRQDIEKQLPPQPVYLSSVTNTQLNEILEICHIKYQPLLSDHSQPPSISTFQPFEWDSSDENQQHPRCLAFLQALFQLPTEIILFKCPEGFNDTYLFSPAIHGQADLAISVNVSEPENATFVVFELTKPGNISKGRNEAKLTHLTTDIKSVHNVITVFTDLQQHWEIFWFEPGEQANTLLACRKYLPSEAIDLIRRFVAYSYSRIPKLNVPAVQVPPEIQRICKVSRDMGINAQADDDDDVAKIDESFFDSEEEYKEWQMQQKLINALRYSHAFAEPFRQLSQDLSGLGIVN